MIAFKTSIFAPKSTSSRRAAKSHSPKRWEGLSIYHPKDTALTSEQNTYLAPFNISDAGLCVFSNTTLRKGDYAALYGVQCIVSRAEYERDYKGIGRIECDYLFEISTDAPSD
jgi:hypothetical protein